ncbi:hypothetical protein AGR7A_pAt10019 [Agrobacterium deltaense NCPPB 1641]|uniref:Uncharacterized protein n=1 Tax=Agrobacterium deltaense NCPPB 1641 TaxID=1183425 RepID=A0A1S7U6S2_9HYPH|nr:hypothetical protein AGR7A_pAt10019 [Agrobacterium deltaense NCPPB 1641]
MSFDTVTAFADMVYVPPPDFPSPS